MWPFTEHKAQALSVVQPAPAAQAIANTTANGVWVDV